MSSEPAQEVSNTQPAPEQKAAEPVAAAVEPVPAAQEPAASEAPANEAPAKKKAQEPVFDHDKKKAELEEKLEKMFNSLGDYMQAELDMTTDDFKMLQELNMAALQKYETMTHNAGDFATYLESIQANCKKIKIINKIIICNNYPFSFIFIIYLLMIFI